MCWLDGAGPKYGLFYHWPKDIAQTSQMSDYYSTTAFRNAEIPSFQVNRAKFERDLIALLAKYPNITFLQATVKSIQLAERCPNSGKMKGLHEVSLVPPAEFFNTKADPADADADASNTPAMEPAAVNPVASTAPLPTMIKGRHVIDACGRRFLLGTPSRARCERLRTVLALPAVLIYLLLVLACVVPRAGTQKSLMIKDPELLEQVHNASVWIRVKNCNYDEFMCTTSNGRALSSHLYATNHFCGEGHWLWVIPIETRGGREISIGISAHHQMHTLKSDAQQHTHSLTHSRQSRVAPQRTLLTYASCAFGVLRTLNTSAKFVNFLYANHRVLHDVVVSGDIVDFHVLPRLAHVATEHYSHDQWYILGEAAYNADPWYSTGMAFISDQVQWSTAAILAQDSGHKDAKMLVERYNIASVAATTRYLLTIRKHWKHLGNASIMSTRIFSDACGGISGVCAAVGKWILCTEAAKGAPKSLEDHRWFVDGTDGTCGLYGMFDELIDRGVNIGFMDYNHVGMIDLPWWRNQAGLLPALDDVDHFLTESKFDYKTSNLYKHSSVTWITLFGLITQICWRGWGLAGFLQPRFYQRLGWCLKQAWMFHRKGGAHAQFLEDNNVLAGLARNRAVADFNNYKAPGKVQPW